MATFKAIIAIIVILIPVQAAFAQQVNGLVRSKSSKGLTTTNERGYFSFSIPEQISIRFSAVGYLLLDTLIQPTEELIIIELDEKENLLNAVVVKNNYEDDFRNNVLRINVKEISKLPSIMGEKDLMKAVQLLPGVQNIVEGASGFSVNGGGADQNLVLFDNVPVYNFSHLFGLFSIFNTDAVKDLELSKDAISSRYGGRGSSVLNIRLKDGDLKQWHAHGSVGLLSSKIAVNGPLIKEKVSVLATARRSYFDLLTKPFGVDENYFLGDYLLKATARINPRAQIHGGIYSSNDTYRENFDKADYKYPFSFGWENKLYYLGASYYKNNWYFHYTLYNSFYRFFYDEKVISKPSSILSQFNSSSAIRDIGTVLKVEKSFKKSRINFGGGIVYRKFSPKYLETESQQSTYPIVENSEAHAYVEYGTRIFPFLTLETGFRGIRWENEKTARYFLEPRVSSIIDFRFFKAKIGYFGIHQFVHLLSNTGGALPTDTWILANDDIKASFSRQWSVTLMKSFELGAFSAYLETGAYIKKMDNLANYSNGEGLNSITAALSENPDSLNNFISTGNGNSKGIGALIRLDSDKFTSWLSYTLARTYHIYEEINKGSKYYPNFDRLHTAKLTGLWNVNPGFSLGGILTWSSPNPVTLPIGTYYTEQIDAPIKESYFFLEENSLSNYRNNYRLKPYFRLDLNASWKKKKKHHERIWEVNIFNATLHKNPLYYTLKYDYDADSKKKSWNYKEKYFLRIIPSVSYRINF